MFVIPIMKKRSACTLIAAYFFLSFSCYGQYPRLVPFKNDPEISDARGVYADSVSQRFLYKFQEPLLSNYYLGKEVYRFILEPSLLNTTFLIKIEKTDKGASITTKELVNNHEPSDILDTRDGSGSYFLYTLDLNEQASLAPFDYSAFKALIDTFFAHPVSPDRMGNDGANWTLEVSTSSGYYKVRKWHPDKNDPLRKIGELMIDLSKLQRKKWVKKW
jgi:hypothetical protein